MNRFKVLGKFYIVDRCVKNLCEPINAVELFSTQIFVKKYTNIEAEKFKFIGMFFLFHMNLLM